MTTEVAIINRSAVALAADSAVTVSSISGKKVYNTANKLFSLSRRHPVGVMIYGNASLNQIPWETLIKVYRKTSQTKSFNNLQDCATDFIDFFGSIEHLFSKTDEVSAVVAISLSAFFDIKQAYEEDIRKKTEISSKITKTEKKSIFKDRVEKSLGEWEAKKDAGSLKGVSAKAIESKHKNNFEIAINHVFEGIPLTQKLNKQLVKIGCLSIIKDSFSSSYSGIVIAGFGKDELTPDLASYKIDAMYEGSLKFARDDDKSYTTKPSPAIISFAQDDIISTFINGIDPLAESVFKAILEDSLETYFNLIIKSSQASGISISIDDLKRQYEQHKKFLMDSYASKTDAFKKDYYRDPLDQVIGILPKEELAEMAESLVSLTALKRRVSMQIESVGGPIDVALISKGDGFIWIKRKHYFESDLNPDFFVNRK